MIPGVTPDQVTRLDRTRSCAGAGNGPAGEFPCRYPARWLFRGLEETDADGTYCWLHLLDQLDANPAEGERTLAALAAAQSCPP
jgi:hypothetical protein